MSAAVACSVDSFNVESAKTEHHPVARFSFHAFTDPLRGCFGSVAHRSGPSRRRSGVGDGPSARNCDGGGERYSRRPKRGQITGDDDEIMITDDDDDDK